MNQPSSPADPVQGRVCWFLLGLTMLVGSAFFLWHYVTDRGAPLTISFISLVLSAFLGATGRIVTMIVSGILLVPLLIWIVRKTLSSLRFGRLTFIPDAIPVAPGQLLTGCVPLRRAIRNRHRVRACLVASVWVKPGQRSKAPASSETNSNAEVKPPFMLIRKTIATADAEVDVQDGRILIRV